MGCGPRYEEHLARSVTVIGTPPPWALGRGGQQGARWHETRRADEGHRWLRDLVAKTVIANSGG
jgi:hypothetical protein